MRQREQANRGVIALGMLVAIVEALTPWANYTPDIPPWLHIAVAALLLPIRACRPQKEIGSDFSMTTMCLNPLL